MLNNFIIDDNAEGLVRQGSPSLLFRGDGFEILLVVRSYVIEGHPIELTIIVMHEGLVRLD
jgi:hypothetical protein